MHTYLTGSTGVWCFHVTKTDGQLKIKVLLIFTSRARKGLFFVGTGKSQQLFKVLLWFFCSFSLISYFWGAFLPLFDRTAAGVRQEMKGGSRASAFGVHTSPAEPSAPPVFFFFFFHFWILMNPTSFCDSLAFFLSRIQPTFWACGEQVGKNSMNPCSKFGLCVYCCSPDDFNFHFYVFIKYAAVACTLNNGI